MTAHTVSAAMSGKWVWIWNWPRCDGGDPKKVAARLRQAGCRGVLVKAHDGPHWFDQGRPWREIAAALKDEGLAVAAWAYLYGRDPAGEARLIGESVSYGGADLFVMDVEAEFEGREDAAADLCQRVRQAVGAGYPLYYSTFAIARYHRTFPYDVFSRYCRGTAPQVYWNAFRWPVHQAVEWTYEDYSALGTAPQDVFPVAGLYAARGVPHPAASDVHDFSGEAARRGSPGISFWSYEHMNEEMWTAVTEASTHGAELIDGGTEMTDAERQQLDRLQADHAALAGRVARLEAEVATLEHGPRPHTYTVRPGDTLSGIAARLGVGDWRRLYEANRAVIGPDPNLVRPGQVLDIPG